MESRGKEKVSLGTTAPHHAMAFAWGLKKLIETHFATIMRRRTWNWSRSILQCLAQGPSCDVLETHEARNVFLNPAPDHDAMAQKAAGPGTFPFKPPSDPSHHMMA